MLSQGGVGQCVAGEHRVSGKITAPSLCLETVTFLQKAQTQGLSFCISTLAFQLLSNAFK